MKKNFMLLFAAAVALSSCGGGFKKTPGGILYNIHEDKTGPVAKVGDFVSVNVLCKTDADSVLFNTYDQGKPIGTVLSPPQSKSDVVSALTLLSEGDSATVKIVADSIFKAGQQKPPGFKGKFLVYEIKVEKLIAKGNDADTVFQRKINDYYKDVVAKIKTQEPAKTAAYIKKRDLKLTKTASGLQYEFTKEGSGPKPVAGDTVEVYYAGRLTTDKVFDTNIKDIAQKEKMFNAMNPYKTLKFPVGQQKVIAGWDEGLLLMNKGSKATFVVPSQLAYGEQGGGPIPPFATLIFDVEMVNIIKPSGQPAPVAPAPVAPQGAR